MKNLESYAEFLARIDAFETRKLHLGNGDFVPNPSVALKVGEDNAFRPFYGDTVVFDLHDAEKIILQEYAKLLHREVPEAFCEQLGESTFHMTLHDLSNSPEKERAARCMPSNSSRLRVVLEDEPVAPQTIQMRSRAIFNMVNTSLVLGLYPVDEAEYEKLMALYQLVDYVKALPYPFTPHITLAYFSSTGFDSASARKLEQLIWRMNTMHLNFQLDTKRLVYQHFESMNDYRTVFPLAKG